MELSNLGNYRTNARKSRGCEGYVIIEHVLVEAKCTHSQLEAKKYCVLKIGFFAKVSNNFEKF